MKEIPLSQGKIALVDDEWFERLNQHKWYAWTDGHNWYAVRTSKGIRMHRIIMNAAKGVQIDHINHNGLDNRLANLRFCTYSQNQANRRPNQNSRSPYKGVRWSTSTKLWAAAIIVQGKEHWLGLYDDDADAARAYDRAAKEHFGGFANLNNV